MVSGADPSALLFTSRYDSRPATDARWTMSSDVAAHLVVGLDQLVERREHLLLVLVPLPRPQQQPHHDEGLLFRRHRPGLRAGHRHRRPVVVDVRRAVPRQHVPVGAAQRPLVADLHRIAEFARQLPEERVQPLDERVGVGRLPVDGRRELQDERPGVPREGCARTARSSRRRTVGADRKSGFGWCRLRPGMLSEVTAAGAFAQHGNRSPSWSA